jgi:hypothetical protein
MAMSDRVAAAIGAAATVANVLTGRSSEYFGKAGILTLYGNARIVGMTMSLSFNQGPDSQLPVPPGSALNLASTPGTVKANEDFVGQWPVPANTRLVLAVVNPGAASTADFALVVS